MAFVLHYTAHFDDDVPREDSVSRNQVQAPSKAKQLLRVKYPQSPQVPERDSTLYNDLQVMILSSRRGAANLFGTWKLAPRNPPGIAAGWGCAPAPLKHNGLAACGKALPSNLAHILPFAISTSTCACFEC